MKMLTVSLVLTQPSLCSPRPTSTNVTSFDVQLAPSEPLTSSTQPPEIMAPAGPPSASAASSAPATMKVDRFLFIALSLKPIGAERSRRQDRTTVGGLTRTP